MRKFVLTRLAGLVLVLLAMTLAIFLLRQVVPSDPARAAVGPNAPESVVKLKREELGLDKPVYTQYFDYLGNVVHGDFGTSTRTLAPVSDDIRTYFPASLELMLAAILGRHRPRRGACTGPDAAPARGLPARVPAGGRVRSHLPGRRAAVAVLLVQARLAARRRAHRPRRRADRPDRAAHHRLRARGPPDAFWDACQHLLLPAFTLALPMVWRSGAPCCLARGTLRQDYIRTARSKGMTEGSAAASPRAAQLRNGRAVDGRPPGRAAARQPARRRAHLRVARARLLHSRVARQVGPVGRPRRCARVRGDTSSSRNRSWTSWGPRGSSRRARIARLRAGSTRSAGISYPT